MGCIVHGKGLYTEGLICGMIFAPRNYLVPNRKAVETVNKSSLFFSLNAPNLPLPVLRLFFSCTYLEITAAETIPRKYYQVTDGSVMQSFSFQIELP